MGCGNSAPTAGAEFGEKPKIEVDKSEQLPLSYTATTIKAALLIQKWYRRYLARLEVRRRYTWTIFQKLEYAGEQDQLRLYNFFHDLMEQLEEVQAEGKDPTRELLTAKAVVSPQHVRQLSLDEEDLELYSQTNPSKVEIAESYSGPHIKLPITSNQVESLIAAFKKKQVLHAHYVLEILHEVRKVLKDMPNISRATARGPGKQITVCGDIHGKLADLLTIFYKNGLPDASNPYVFNGDFVDRGPFSVEICILLFCLILLNPKSVFLNRGNHEDYIVNLQYGFTKEIVSKYKDQAKKVRLLFEDVFSWLPLATLIDDKILVTHGGISSGTDLQRLEAISRHRYLSALKPPFINDDQSQGVNREEVRQLLDILWSDPMKKEGSKFNTLRNGGSLWGPDVTKSFLSRNKLKLLIRSHECKQEGYEYTHNNMVLTVFSASNYYTSGSNKGAYIKLSHDLTPRVIQFVVTKESERRLTFSQKVDHVEASALKVLKAKLCAHKTQLLAEFTRLDPNNTGLLSASAWYTAVSGVISSDLPWWSLRHKLVSGEKSGRVKYLSTFHELTLKSKLKDQGQSGVGETLYRHKESLEAIFRAIDRDNSGFISMDEFSDACGLLGQHTGSKISPSDVKAMARNMDLNKDGQIDFNEFLEAFRIVDKFGQELEKRRVSQDSVNFTAEVK